MGNCTTSENTTCADDFFDDLFGEVDDLIEEGLKKRQLFVKVVTSTAASIGLPLTLVAIFALYAMVRKDNPAPVYVINLLLSDLLQLGCMVVRATDPYSYDHFVFHLYYYGLYASVGSMVTVAMERYLVIAFPLWYRFRRTVKTSAAVCLSVWLLSTALLILDLLSITYDVLDIDFAITIMSIYFLFPFPLLLFFLAGTVRALSASVSVPAEEKKRILASLVLVLLTYTFFFLPYVIVHLFFDGLNLKLNAFSFACVSLSPLMDLFLYVFMRRGIVDRCFKRLCVCTVGKRDDNNTSVEIETVSESVQ